MTGAPLSFCLAKKFVKQYCLLNSFMKFSKNKIVGFACLLTLQVILSVWMGLSSVLDPTVYQRRWSVTGRLTALSHGQMKHWPHAVSFKIQVFSLFGDSFVYNMWQALQKWVACRTTHFPVQGCGVMEGWTKMIFNFNVVLCFKFSSIKTLFLIDKGK